MSTADGDIVTEVMMFGLQQESRAPTRDERLAAAEARKAARIAAMTPMEKKYFCVRDDNGEIREGTALRRSQGIEQRLMSFWWLLVDILVTLDKIRVKLNA